MKSQSLNIFILFGFSFVVFIGCKPKPEPVVNEFLEHINNQEFDKARELATPESEHLISLLESFSSMGGESQKRQIKEIKCVVDDDKATCSYCCNLDGESENIDMVYRDGKWLVDMKKESLIDEGTNGLEGGLQKGMEKLNQAVDSLNASFGDTNRAQ